MIPNKGLKTAQISGCPALVSLDIASQNIKYVKTSGNSQLVLSDSIKKMIEDINAKEASS